MPGRGQAGFSRIPLEGALCTLGVLLLTVCSPALAGPGRTLGMPQIRSPGMAVAATEASVARPTDFWKGSGVIHLKSMPMCEESSCT